MKFTGKILIVDDEAHIRKFVGLVVRSLGSPKVIEAGDGAAAVEICARERPELVLLDVNMPRLDGLQTLQALRQQDPECVVVMLTSLINRQTVEECLRLGATGYLRKDTPPEEISAELSRILTECFGEDPPTNPAPHA
ncbi:MAG TPA: response regulator transcription factor [Lacunisphaera sp.]|nr:response regulator transcription factor [Lacunisphaera sp.]